MQGLFGGLPRLRLAFGLMRVTSQFVAEWNAEVTTLQGTTRNGLKTMFTRVAGKNNEVAFLCMTSQLCLLEPNSHQGQLLINALS